MKTTITFVIDSGDLDVNQNLRMALVTKDSLSHAGSHTFSAAWAALQGSVAASSLDNVQVERLPGWLAGWNVPGYLPDDEPQLFPTYDEALAYLHEELERDMERWLDDLTSSDDSKAAAIREQYAHAIGAIAERPTNTDQWVQCGKHVWWLRVEG